MDETTFDQVFLDEIQNLKHLEDTGVLKFLDRIETDTHGYLVFGKISQTDGKINFLKGKTLIWLLTHIFWALLSFPGPDGSSKFHIARLRDTTSGCGGELTHPKNQTKYLAIAL